MYTTSMVVYILFFTERIAWFYAENSSFQLQIGYSFFSPVDDSMHTLATTCVVQVWFVLHERYVHNLYLGH